MDVDGNGQIVLEEFIDWWLRYNVDTSAFDDDNNNSKSLLV
jgi:hypothetical protein